MQANKESENNLNYNYLLKLIELKHAESKRDVAQIFKELKKYSNLFFLARDLGRWQFSCSRSGVCAALCYELGEKGVTPLILLVPVPFVNFGL